MFEELTMLQAPDVKAIERSANGSLRMIKSTLRIESPEEYAEVATEVAAIKRKLDDLNAARKSITQPLDNAKKAVMDLFRRPTSTYEEAEKLGKGLMLDFDNRERERERAQSNAVDAAMIFAPTAVAESAKVSGVSTRTSLDFEVLDPLALAAWIVNERRDMVGILSIDSVKLRGLVRSVGGSIQIPGVRVFEKRSIAVKAQ